VLSGMSGGCITSGDVLMDGSVTAVYLYGDLVEGRNESPSSLTGSRA